MSSYTMQLREFIEHFTQDETNQLSHKQMIEIGRTKLFDFDYPFFDPNYKAVFETNFIRNFYMREIGFETESLFKFQLETWLHINMPYYNKLFESELKEYDILSDYKVEIKTSKVLDTIANEDITKNQQETKSHTINKSGNVNENNTNNTTNNIDINVIATKTGSENEETTNTNNVDVSSSTKGEQTNETENTNKKNEFGRDVSSDTPDSRLNITVNQGETLITYASKIDENSKTTTDEGTSISNVNTNDTQESETNEKFVGNNVTSTNENMNENTNQTNVETSNGNKNIISSDTDTGNENNTVLNNDEINKNISTIEDYIESRIGKTSSASFAKLIMEYRESLLRIEKQIFNEMNELFMLVY